MFDISPVVKAILEGGGIWAALFLLCVFGLGVLALALRQSWAQRLEDAKECASEAKEASEIRFQDGTKLLVALNKSTEVAFAMEATAQTRAAAFGEFQRAQVAIAEQAKAYQTSSKEQHDRIERRQEDMQRSLAAIEQALRTAASKLEDFSQAMRSLARSRE